MCWQHHNKSSATLFCYKATGPECLLLCTVACLFPPSERCQDTSLPPPLHPLMLWHTPLFSLFVWSCLDYWNALLSVGLLTNTIKWLQLGQNWLLSPLSGTRKGGLYKFQVWWGSNAFIRLEENFKVFFLSQLPFSFNWLPQGPLILMAPKHSPQSYQSILDNKFPSFLIKSTARWGWGGESPYIFQSLSKSG